MGRRDGPRWEGGREQRLKGDRAELASLLGRPQGIRHAGLGHGLHRSITAERPGGPISGSFAKLSSPAKFARDKSSHETEALGFSLQSESSFQSDVRAERTTSADQHPWQFFGRPVGLEFLARDKTDKPERSRQRRADFE